MGYSSSFVSTPRKSNEPLRRTYNVQRSHTKFFPHTLQLIEVRLVLLLRLDLLLDTLEQPDRRRIVVDPPRRSQSRFNNSGRRDEIVGEAIVQSALDLEDVERALEKGDVSFGEGFVRLLLVS